MVLVNGVHLATLQRKVLCSFREHILCSHSYFITLPPLHCCQALPPALLRGNLGKRGTETQECPAGEADGVLLRSPLDSKSPTDFILASVEECSLEPGASSSVAAKRRQLCQEQGRKTSVHQETACVYETRKPNPWVPETAEAW